MSMKDGKKNGYICHVVSIIIKAFCLCGSLLQNETLDIHTCLLPVYLVQPGHGVEIGIEIHAADKLVFSVI